MSVPNQPQSEPPSPLLWVDIDTDALTANAVAVRKALESPGGAPRVMAVVKADGYGHGAVNAARAFVAGGIHWLGVTTLDEALAIAHGAPDIVRSLTDPAPSALGGLLVFTPMIDDGQASAAIAAGLTVTICDNGHTEIVARAAEALGTIANVHLKVNTGMGRFGEAPDCAIDTAKLIANVPSLKLTGVYTHFARALEPDLEPTKAALAQFTAFCDKLKATGIDHGLRHSANSAAALRLPESRMDLVRIGTVLYGQYPAATVPRVAGLNADTWTARARIVFVHDIAPGTTVGYGSEYRAQSKRRAAVIPVGFADGFATAPVSAVSGLRGVKALLAQLTGKSQPYVIIDGVRAPVLGRVAMQTIVVDVTDIPGVAIGTAAEIPMRRLAARASIPHLPTRRGPLPPETEGSF